jgi:hypothetical protein
MAVQQSVTRIANRAYVHLGQNTRISSIDDVSNAAQRVKAVWDDARDTALSLHPWNFATKRQMLERDPEGVPAFGWSYRFRLPADCLRWLPPSRDDRDYVSAVEEDGFLLCNEEGPIPARFIYRNEDVTRWSSSFRTVMSYQLAFEMCEDTTEQKGLRDRLLNDRDEAVREAKKLDGLASGDRDRGNITSQSRILSARHGGTGRGGRYVSYR